MLIIGVNGVGKTTSIGKLANRYKKQGKRVLLCAADTFRAAAIDQRMIFRRAYALGSEAIVLCHNHPSGSLSVSPQDIRATQEIHSACRLLGFRLADHVIFVPGGYISLAERGLL